MSYSIESKFKIDISSLIKTLKIYFEDTLFEEYKKIT